MLKIAMRFWRILVVNLAALSLIGQERPIGQGVNFYTKEKEAALGKQFANEVLRTTTRLDDDAAQAYVERVGGKLAEHLPDTSWTFHFAVIVDDRGGPTHEPVALPGGYIFVPQGLLKTTQDENEFAGMLAHAMVHTAARHGTRDATRMEIANQTTIPLIYIGGWPRAESIMIPVAFRKFWRACEFEADRVAVSTMAAAGYDPAALLRYIRRVEPELTEAKQANSSMPAHAQRVEALEKAIGSLNHQPI